MAQVPQLSTPEVAAQVNPVGPQNVNPQGANALEAGAQATGDFAQQALKIQQKMNETAANTAYANTTAAAEAAVANFKESNNGIYAAMNAPAAMKNIQDTFDAGKQGLSLDAQTMYDSATRRVMTYALSAIQQHTATQTRAANKASSTAVIQTNQALAKNVGLAQGTDSEEFHQALGALIQPTMDLIGAEGQGLDPNSPAGKLALKTVTGKVIADIVQDSVDNNDYPKARALFDLHKDDMTPKQQEPLQRRLGVMQKTYEPDMKADAFLSGTAPTNTGQPVDMVHAITSAVPGAIVVPQSNGSPTTRTAEDNARVGGVANSHHLTGTAMDLLPAPGQTRADLIQSLQAIPGIKIIDEGPGAKNSTGPHVHVQWSAPAQVAHPFTVAPNEDPDEAYNRAMLGAFKFAEQDPALKNTEEKQRFLQSVQSRVNMQLLAVKNGQSAALDTLALLIHPADGSPGPTSVADLQTRPGAVNALSMLPPKMASQIPGIIASAASQPATPVQNENAKYIAGVIATQPGLINQINWAQYPMRAQDYQTLRLQATKAQANIARTEANTTAMLREPSVAQYVKTNFGTDDTLKASNPKYLSFVGALQGRVQAFNADPANNGKVAQSSDIAQIMTQLATEPTHVVGPGNFFGPEQGPGYTIPKNLRQVVTAQFAQAHPGVQPNEQNLTAYYNKIKAKVSK